MKEAASLWIVLWLALWSGGSISAADRPNLIAEGRGGDRGGS